MSDFDEGIRNVKYFIEKAALYNIIIYYSDYEEAKLEAEMPDVNNLPEERLYLKDKVSDLSGESNTLHIFYERKRFYGINADGTAHHFRLGVALTDGVVDFLSNKYRNFKLMDNRRLESGMQNKVFFIELMIKEKIINKNKKN